MAVPAVEVFLLLEGAVRVASGLVGLPVELRPDRQQQVVVFPLPAGVGICLVTVESMFGHGSRV